MNMSKQDLYDPNNTKVGFEIRALNIFKHGYEQAVDTKIKAYYKSCMADVFVYYLSKENMQYATRYYYEAIVELNQEHIDLTIFIMKKFNHANRITGDERLLKIFHNQIIELESLKKGNPNKDRSLKELFESTLEFVSNYNERVAKQLCFINLAELMDLYSEDHKQKNYLENAFAILASERTLGLLINKLSILTVELALWEDAKKYLGLKLQMIRSQKPAEVNTSEKPFTNMEPSVLVRLAIAHLNLGDRKEADRNYKEGTILVSNVKDKFFLAELLRDMGLFKGQLNQLAEAKTLLIESFEMFDKLDLKENAQIILLQIIQLSAELKEDKEVDKYSKKAIKTLKYIWDLDLKIETLIEIIEAYLKLNDLEKAQRTIGVANNKQIANKKIEAQFMMTLANYFNRNKEKEKSKEFFDKGVEISKRMEDKMLECELIGKMGDSYNETGNYEESKKLTNEAIKIAVEIGDKEEECKWTGNLGEIYKNEGNKQESKQCYEKAIELAKQSNSFFWHEYWKTALQN